MWFEMLSDKRIKEACLHLLHYKREVLLGDQALKIFASMLLKSDLLGKPNAPLNTKFSKECDVPVNGSNRMQEENVNHIDFISLQ